MMATLALGLLLLLGAAAPESIKHSTDEQGVIHIGNTGPTSQEKAGVVKAPAGVKASARVVAPWPGAPGEPPPPGLLPPQSRRSRRGPAGNESLRPKNLEPLAVPPGPAPPPAGPAPSPAK